MIEYINCLASNLAVDFIIAGDQPTTRSLAGMRDQLSVQVFPMLNLTTFDLLNDKWRFFSLCKQLSIRCPASTLVRTCSELASGARRGLYALPAVAKPLSLDGNRGVVILEPSNFENAIASVAYEPIIVQQFIPGQDVGASIFAENGEIKACVIHRVARATYRTFRNAEIEAALRKIAKATCANGILNFDMRLAPNGQVYFLECNPRVYFKMNLTMLTGLNFAGLGLSRTPSVFPVSPPEGAAVRMPKAIAATLPLAWRLTRRDLAMLHYIVSDPIPYIRESLHIDWEDRSY